MPCRTLTVLVWALFSVSAALLGMLPVRGWLWRPDPRPWPAALAWAVYVSATMYMNTNGGGIGSLSTPGMTLFKSALFVYHAIVRTVECFERVRRRGELCVLVQCLRLYCASHPLSPRGWRALLGIALFCIWHAVFNSLTDNFWTDKDARSAFDLVVWGVYSGGLQLLSLTLSGLTGQLARDLRQDCLGALRAAGAWVPNHNERVAALPNDKARLAWSTRRRSTAPAARKGVGGILSGGQDTSGDSLEDTLGDGLDSTLGDTVGSALGDNWDDNHDGNLGDTLGDTLENTLEETLGYISRDTLGDTLGDPLGNTLGCPELRDPLGDTLVGPELRGPWRASSPRDESRWRWLRMRHMMLLDMGGMASAITCWQALVMIVFTVTYTTTCVSTTVGSLAELQDGPLDVYSVLYRLRPLQAGLGRISLFVFSFYTFQRAAQEHTKLSQELQGFLADTPDIPVAVMREVEKFIVQIALLDGYFDVLGMFRLDLGAMKAVLATITTYLFVLMQFRISLY